jgi:chitinase
VLSAATLVTPFRDASGGPSSSVADFAHVLDCITIMDFDLGVLIDSSSLTLDPMLLSMTHVHLRPTRDGSAVAVVEAWTAAGVPAGQIMLGVASCGHSCSASPSDAFVHGSDTELAAHPIFNPSN